MLNAVPVHIGLVHGSLAARSKWPDALGNGQRLEWTVFEGIPEGASVDAWVIGTRGTTKERLDAFQRLRSTGPLNAPILVLLNPREDQAPWLSVGADAYHEVSSSAALMAQRIKSLLPAPENNFNRNQNLGNILAMDEADRWQATFNAAAAGILTGRTQGFLEALESVAKTDKPGNAETTLKMSRSLLHAVEWELNNAEAETLLQLKEPVALDSGFIDRMTPLHGPKFLKDILAFRSGKSRVSSEWLVRGDPAETRHVHVEFTIPENLGDCMLVTLLDISARIRLEQELRDHVQSLEDRVKERTRDIHIANQKLQLEGNHRQRLTEQVRENLVQITQGIMSAKKILEVALPGRTNLKASFPKSMIIERPRDILGGDFLHVHRTDEMDTLALVDSTGHGIPGAMVSLMGYTLLHQSITSTPDLSPQRILESFRRAFVQRMKTQSADPQMHGFDAGIITLDRERAILRFSGAKEDLFHIREGVCHIHRGTRSSIELSTFSGGRNQLPQFEECTIDVKPGDQFYLNTDGVRDQFGGPNNRKFGRKRFADLLIRHSGLPLMERKRAIQKDLLLWKGANAKVDDATLIGFEI